MHFPGTPDESCTVRSFAQDGDRFWKLPSCYVRGNTIKYLCIPDQVVSLVQEDQQKPRDNKPRGRGGHRGGRGGDGARGLVQFYSLSRRSFQEQVDIAGGATRTVTEAVVAEAAVVAVVAAEVAVAEAILRVRFSTVCLRVCVRD